MTERDAPSGLWPGPWPAEDGGPRRLQSPHGVRGLDLQPGEALAATSRDALASTMVVTRNPGEVYLLCHTGGDGAVSWVERIDPETLAVVERSPDLTGGPTWPGGLAAHADGTLHVVFGNHVHRLSADTALLASTELPRRRPYNSFVTLPDGHLATKDFSGPLPAGSSPGEAFESSELLVLDPGSLAIVDRLVLPEPSVARLSACAGDIYAIGDDSLMRVRWDGRRLSLDDAFTARYRTSPDQGHGWDAVIADDAAWFLDNGVGTEHYAGTLRGLGVTERPLHLVRVDLVTGAADLTEVCGLPGGIVANPPAVDPGRRIVVGYDSGNGRVAAFSYDDVGATTALWTSELDHGGHPIVFSDTGELVLGDHGFESGGEHVVVLDIETGVEKARVATGSPLQSVLFPAVGFDRDLYLCTFTTVSRITVV